MRAARLTFVAFGVDRTYTGRLACRATTRAAITATTTTEITSLGFDAVASRRSHAQIDRGPEVSAALHALWAAIDIGLLSKHTTIEQRGASASERVSLSIRRPSGQQTGWTLGLNGAF